MPTPSIWAKNWIPEIVGMGGLGDSIYQRPFIRAQLAYRKPQPVYLWTSWPELYIDFAPQLQMIRPFWMSLRTQKKNIQSSAWQWASQPVGGRNLVVHYALADSEPNILREMSVTLPLMGHPFVFDLPEFGASPVTSEKPVAVLRPLTLRREWRNTARGPRPEYLHQASRLLREAGYHVVVVADCAGSEEHLVGPEPECDEAYLKGELAVSELLALVRHAAVVVGGVGWIVPACVASRTAAVIIGGGCGGYNAHEVITDPRMGPGLDTLRYVLPDAYCRCRNNLHDCDKHISDFGPKFTAALEDATEAEARAA